MSKLKSDSNTLLLLFIIASTLILSSFAYVLNSGMLIDEHKNNTNSNSNSTSNLNPTPDPDPTPEPDPTPNLNPTPNPDPTPEPDPMPNPNPTPNPDPTPEPDPTPNPNPTPDPDPTPEPDPTPLPKYSLIINSSGNGKGSIIVSPIGGSYPSGTVVILTPIPDDGSIFTSWRGDLSGSTTPISITMNSTKTILATFTAIEYTLTIHVVGNGSVTKNPNKTTYHYDESVQLIPESGTGYTFSSWTGALTGTANPETLIIKKNREITAIFTSVATNHTLTINIVGGGSISKNPDQTSYTLGSTVQLTATANAGWTFLSWSSDLTGSTNPNSITMNDDKTVTATFVPEYTITTSAGSGGSISPSGNVNVQQDSDQGFTITPDTGYDILDVLVDGSSVGAAGTYTFVGVTNNHTIAASFKLKTYTITASGGVGGSISPSGSVSVNYGSDQSFTIDVDSGYHIVDVVVDSVPMGPVTSFTFTNIQGDHEISVSFAVNP